MSGGHSTNLIINRKLSARLHKHAVSRSCGYLAQNLKKMEDLFKKLGEITKPEKQGGFFDLPKDTRCKDKSHQPPTHIRIPQGKGYRHVCPSCGKVTDLIPPQISF